MNKQSILPSGYGSAMDITPRVDWDVVYKASLPALLPPDHPHVVSLRHLNGGVVSPVFIKDCRTICMGAGRQNGKSAWAVRLVVEDANTLLIARDKNIRDVLTRAVQLDSRPKKTITITIDADDPSPTTTVEAILAQWGLLNSTRVFTFRDLESKFANEPEWFANFDRFIIDDALYNLKFQSIINWVANLNRPNVQVIALG